MSRQTFNFFTRDQTTPISPLNMDVGPFSLDFKQLHSGRSAGIWQLDVACGNFRASFLPTRGMSVEDVHIGDFRFGWRSPVRGPVHPSYVPIAEPSGLGFLDGFTELLVRCGLTNNGAPQFGANGQLELALHGRIGNLPAQNLQAHVEGSVLEIVAEVDEIRFHFEKWRLTTQYRMTAGQASIEVIDTVTNLSGQLRDFQILYHFNLGEPLLEPGGKIEAPLHEISPRNPNTAADLERWSEIDAPRPDDPEIVVLTTPKGDEHGQTLSLLTNRQRTAAAAIECNLRELPYLTFWKNFRDPHDGYVIGLEPATNYPNPKRFEAQHNRTRKLKPGESTAFHWAMHFANTKEDVQSLRAQIQKIQGSDAPKISPEPNPATSSAAINHS